MPLLILALQLAPEGLWPLIARRRVGRRVIAVGTTTVRVLESAVGGGMVAGKGWIALALTTFATWRPLRVLLGAYLFGGVTMLQFHLQSVGVDVPSQFLSMLPYLATIVVLALISHNPRWLRVNMPASIGKSFHPGQ